MYLFCKERFLCIQPNETCASYYIKYIFYNNHFNIMKTFRCLLYNLYPSFKCDLLKLIIILCKNISTLLTTIAFRKQRKASHTYVFHPKLCLTSFRTNRIFYIRLKKKINNIHLLLYSIFLNCLLQLLCVCHSGFLFL